MTMVIPGGKPRLRWSQGSEVGSELCSDPKAPHRIQKRLTTHRIVAHVPGSAFTIAAGNTSRTPHPPVSAPMPTPSIDPHRAMPSARLAMAYSPTGASPA